MSEKMTLDQVRVTFEAWRDSLPSKHWAKHDLSGAWLAWQACHAAMQGEDVRRDAERYRHCLEVGRYPTICQDGETWMAWKTTLPTSSVSGKSASEALDAAMGERHV